MSLDNILEGIRRRDEEAERKARKRYKPKEITDEEAKICRKAGYQEAVAYFVQEEDPSRFYDLDDTLPATVIGSEMGKGRLRRGDVVSIADITHFQGSAPGRFHNIPGVYYIPGMGRPLAHRQYVYGESVLGTPVIEAEKIGLEDYKNAPVKAKRTLKQSSISDMFRRPELCAACDPTIGAGGGGCTCGQNLRRRR